MSDGSEPQLRSIPGCHIQITAKKESKHGLRVLGFSGLRVVGLRKERD